MPALTSSTAAGEWVFLELNSSPVYLDVER
jgi:hypothetical protein